MIKSGFSQKIIRWYHENRRDLPWRNTSDPYVIWLSEIILQQTRVDQGLPYFERFLKRYPDVKELADSDEQEVLRLWQGLGYYSRARNLHETARHVSNKLSGKFPGNFKELKKLKGVGDYTAAAIASFSFSEVVPVVDGNVFRVLARYFALEWDISDTGSKKKFFDLASELIPENDPATFNQSIMEFGALQCSPKLPDCSTCPLSDNCEAFKSGKTDFFPVKTKKQLKKDVYFYYIIFENGKRFLTQKRTGDGIWKGLNEFYLIESQKPEDDEAILHKIKSRFLSNSFVVRSISDEIIHILSHRKIHAFFIHLEVGGNDFESLQKHQKLRASSAAEIEKLPKPVLIDNYLNHIIF